MAASRMAAWYAQPGLGDARRHAACPRRRPFADSGHPIRFLRQRRNQSPLANSTPLVIDNQAAIAMGQMPQFTEKQKHIPIRMRVT